MMNTQLGTRQRMADRRRKGLLSNTSRVQWKSQSRHVA